MQNRAEVHRRLREIAGAPLRHERLGQLPEPRLAARQLFAHREEPRHDPLDIAIDRRKTPVEGDRRDGAGGVIADPRQCPQIRPVFRDSPAMALDDGRRAGVQVAGAGVIAEALPEMQHLVERGGGQRVNIRPARHESAKIRADRRHRGLLGSMISLSHTR